MKSTDEHDVAAIVDDFVRQFADSEAEIESSPETKLNSFIVPIGAIEPLSSRHAFAIQLREQVQFGRVVILGPKGTAMSRVIGLTLMRDVRKQLLREEAFDLIWCKNGPMYRPVRWNVTARRYTLTMSLDDSVTVAGRGSWHHRGEVSMAWELTVMARPVRGVYLKVELKDAEGRPWKAHSRWVPFLRKVVKSEQ